jgi:hypothetical protein
MFDPTGTGNYLATNLENLDWAPGSLLAQNGVTAVNNFVAGSGSTSFNDYYEATLGTYGLTDGSIATMPTGNLTIVVGLTEHVVGVTGTPGGTGTSAQFQWDSGPNNWLEVYYNPGGTPLSGQIQGNNFNQGQLILRASITNVNDTIFSVTAGGSSGGLLDQTGHGLYPNITTISGHGSTTVTAQMGDTSSGWWDPRFFNFTDGPVFTNLTMVQNVGLDTPFLSVVPSSGFVDSANLGAIGTAGPAPNLNIGPGTPTGTNPLTDGPNTVGTDNGVSGPDVVFQSDTNQTFAQTAGTIPGGIPEPVTAALGGLGLLGLGLSVLRRRHSA